MVVETTDDEKGKGRKRVQWILMGVERDW